MKRITYYLIPLTLLATLISSCGWMGKQAETDTGDRTIFVGSILPLDPASPAALYGNNVMKGQQKALRELDSTMKSYKLKIMFEDGQGKKLQTINAYSKLYGQGVRIFTTTTSSASLALLPPALRDSVLLFADAAHPDITNPPKPMVFRHSTTAHQEVKAVLEHISQRGDRNLALVYLNDDYGKSVSNLLEQELASSPDIKLVFSEGYDMAERDFGTLALKLRRVDAHTIFIAGFGQSMGLLINRLQTMNVKGRYLASIGLIITNAHTVARDLTGVEYINFHFGEQTASVEPFEMLGYGTIMLIGRAVDRFGNDPVRIAEYISSLGIFTTPSQTMTILPSNDILPDIRIETFK
jgi:branched-chain amino acid transport system substrate-binding protein